MQKKKESKFVGLEHMANRVQSSHAVREKKTIVPKKIKKKVVNPITGRAD